VLAASLTNTGTGAAAAAVPESHAVVGRLEVLHKQAWGSVCNAAGSWGDNEAMVACRSLGFARGHSFGGARQCEAVKHVQWVLSESGVAESCDDTCARQADGRPSRPTPYCDASSFSAAGSMGSAAGAEAALEAVVANATGVACAAAGGWKDSGSGYAPYVNLDDSGCWFQADVALQASCGVSPSCPTASFSTSG
jgi:hypothetical protein